MCILSVARVIPLFCAFSYLYYFAMNAEFVLALFTNPANAVDFIIIKLCEQVEWSGVYPVVCCIM